MRLCYIVDKGFTEYNGEIYCNGIDLNIINRLKNHFDEIIILGQKSTYTESYRPLNIKNVSVKFIPKVGIKLIYKINLHRKIIDNSVKWSDVVMFKGLNGLFALVSSRKNNKISVAYVGGSTKEIVSLIGSPIKKLLAPIPEHIINYSVRKANYVQYVAKYLVNEYPTEGKYIVLSSVKIPPVEDSIKIKRYNKLENINKKDVLNIGIIGYVNNKIKGMDTAIKALSLLDNRFKLSILGKGDNKKLLKLSDDLNVSGRVKFCGALPGGEQVLKWLDDIDIYIQPSLTEGMPRATIEAMSRGCPVIASDVGGLKDLVNPEWRHNPGDYRELASLVNKLSNNNDLCKGKIDNAFAMVRQFEESIIEDAYDNFFTMIGNDLKTKGIRE